VSIIRIAPESRVWVCGLRLHHGLAGLAFIAGGLSSIIIGTALVIDDWPDRWWLNDRCH
jgi:hypothetical protein